MTRASALDCDVLVAGAGPAGSAAASHLALAGLRVIVADTQRFPRDKVCGDFVSPVALGELRRLGMALPRDGNPIRNAALYLDGEELIACPMPRVAGLPALGRVLPRRAFDAALVARARAAGAEVREGVRVTGFRLGRGAIEVAVRGDGAPCRLRARVLVGADGSSSTVARAVRDDAQLDRDRLIAVRAYFEGVAGAADRADLYFSRSSFPGYCWLFPTGPGTANVGVGIIRKTLPPTEEHLRALLDRLIAEDAALRERLRGARPVSAIAGWPLTTYNDRLPVAAPRVLLVGDAAGLINPINGEGIQHALASGRWAAESVVACIGDRHPGRMSAAYTARVEAEIGYDLLLARSIMQLVRNRALNRVWLEMLQAIVARAVVDPEYARVTGGVLAGVIPARRVLALPIVRDTLRQAALRLGREAVGQASVWPNDLIQLGVRATSAAIEVSSAMLAHEDETRVWVPELLTSALHLAGGAVRRRRMERR